MPDFRSTFIPQKTTPALGRNLTKRTFDPVTFAGWVLFIVSVLVAIGLYGYQFLLERSVKLKIDDIRTAKEAIDPELVEDLKEFDVKLSTITFLLDRHISSSAIFDFLEKETITTIGFSSFEYSTDLLDQHKLSLSGEAKDFSSVAFQADVFNENKGVVVNSQFLNFDLSETGDVGFDIVAGLAKESVLYKNNIGSANP